MALRRTPFLTFLALVVSGLILVPAVARAHCDTMDGPVVADARAALAAGDPTPTLKWVNAKQEEELRAVFDKAMKVRALGEEARELADMHLFETLVRLHRASEGAPYTGLKPADAPLDPVVEATDEALDEGSVDELVDNITRVVESGIRRRFEQALAARKEADQDVEAGRAYVRSYVRYVHYVEGLHTAAAGAAAHHAPGQSPAEEPEGAAASQPAAPAPEPPGRQRAKPEPQAEQAGEAHRQPAAQS